MSKSKLTINCKPTFTTPTSGASGLNDLNSSTKQLSAIVAVHQERKRIIDALEARTSKTKNSYFSLEQLRKLIRS